MDNRELEVYQSKTPIEDRFQFRTQGRFRCARPTEGILIIISVILAVVIWIVFYEIWGQQFKFIYDMHEKTDHAFFFAVAFSMITFGLILCTIIIIKMILNGVDYHYTADNNMFSFYSEKAGIIKTDIHYSDVVEISYENYHLFGLIDRGFLVSIVTRTLGTVSFEYLHNKSILSHDRENTPFYIIEQRINAQFEKSNAMKRG